MNSKSLRIKIEDAHFPPSAYTLFSPPRDETLCIEYCSPFWVVFYSERGLQTGKMKFTSETDACDYFYKKLSSWFV